MLEGLTPPAKIGACKVRTLEYIVFHPDATLNDIVEEIQYRYNYDERLRLGGVQWDSLFKRSS